MSHQEAVPHVGSFIFPMNRNQQGHHPARQVKTLNCPEVDTDARKEINTPVMTDIKGAAKSLLVSTKTIRRWIKSGQLPATRIGAKWLIPVGGINALLESGMHPAGEVK